MTQQLKVLTENPGLVPSSHVSSRIARAIQTNLSQKVPPPKKNPMQHNVDQLP